MKLAAVSSELPKHKSRKLFDDKVYVLYNERYEMEKEFKNPKVWGSWASYKFNAEFDDIAQYKLFRERYESLCAGHLHYYDNIVRNGAVDNVMGFIWSDFVKHGSYRVQVLISPPPLKRLGASHNNNGKRSFDEAQAVEAVNAGSPDAEESVDPPKPPPPPPPSMY